MENDTKRTQMNDQTGSCHYLIWMILIQQNILNEWQTHNLFVPLEHVWGWHGCVCVRFFVNISWNYGVTPKFGDQINTFITYSTKSQLAMCTHFTLLAFCPKNKVKIMFFWVCIHNDRIGDQIQIPMQTYLLHGMIVRHGTANKHG